MYNVNTILTIARRSSDVHFDLCKIKDLEENANEIDERNKSYAMQNG